MMETADPTQPDRASVGDLSDSDTSHSSPDGDQGNDKAVSLAYAIPEFERAWYYFGITSAGQHPELLYRTSWEKGPWWTPADRYIAHPPRKFAHPVYNTPLNLVWRTVGPKINDIVSAAVKKSYSINTARFLTVPDGDSVEDGTLGPVVIWISVCPGSTSATTAHEVSQDILRLLADNDITQVDVEWCEGVTSRLAALLPVVGKHNPTANFRRFLTTALSVPIAAAALFGSDKQGTGGFYFHENIDKKGNISNKVLLVTNRHVLSNELSATVDYRRNTWANTRIWVCGSRHFQVGLAKISAEIVRLAKLVCDLAAEIERTKTLKEDEFTAIYLKKSLNEMDVHRQTMLELERLATEIKVNWSNLDSRVIGHLEYSPPLSIDLKNEKYTQDWATIRLKEDTVKPNFMGNVIDLGTLNKQDFERLMHIRTDNKPVVSFPEGGFLKVRGFVSKELLAKPESVDLDDNSCLIVLKDGSSDVTLGRCCGMEAFQRNDDDVESVEVAIYNYDDHGKEFSTRGDSGSLIVNGNGEMVGLLHSGTSKNLRTDKTYITYATPAWRLCEWIKEVYPHADFARETW